MRLYEFEDFLNVVVGEYREYETMYGRDEALRKVAAYASDCCSTFEEETLFERLREEYLDVA